MTKKLVNIEITQRMIKEVEIPAGTKPSEFVQLCWGWYKDQYTTNSTVNGTILENIIELALAREGIGPIHTQAELSFVPFAKFDIMLFEGSTPIALSVKTTIRERWKQADLEADLLKKVHRDAECLLLSLSTKEVASRRNHDEKPIALDGFVLVHTSEFDDLVESLKLRTFTNPGVIPIVQKSKPGANKTCT